MVYQFSVGENIAKTSVPSKPQCMCEGWFNYKLQPYINNPPPVGVKVKVVYVQTMRQIDMVL